MALTPRQAAELKHNCVVIAGFGLLIGTIGILAGALWPAEAPTLATSVAGVVGGALLLFGMVAFLATPSTENQE